MSTRRRKRITTQEDQDIAPSTTRKKSRSREASNNERLDRLEDMLYVRAFTSNSGISEDITPVMPVGTTCQSLCTPTVNNAKTCCSSISLALKGSSLIMNDVTVTNMGPEQLPPSNTNPDPIVKEPRPVGYNISTSEINNCVEYIGKPDNIPKFDGNSNELSVHAWLHRLESLAKIYGWSEKVLVYHLTSNLEGNALLCFGHLQNTNMSWEAWKKQLAEYFPADRGLAAKLHDFVTTIKGPEELSTTIGHDWLIPLEVLKGPKDLLSCIEEYYHDYKLERKLMRSQSCGVHGTTEMRSAYEKPKIPAKLVTGKEQFIHPASLPTDPPPVEPSWHKDLEPLDTTQDGFEKYLDPYLTTSRLHYRSYTADQLSRESSAPARSIITYYTLSNTPMVRTPKTNPEICLLSLSRPKSMYDREKFKQEFREIIRTHNKPTWVPGSFRTEVKDNFTSFMEKPENRINNNEEDIQSMYQKALASLPPNTEDEYSTTLQGYTTENSTVGSQKPLCTIFNPFREKNKRLEIKLDG